MNPERFTPACAGTVLRQGHDGYLEFRFTPACAGTV